MFIGHNPGFHQLAVQLAAHGAAGDLAALRDGFPTAAIAVIDVAAGTWADVRFGAGTLRHYMTPRRLPD